MSMDGMVEIRDTRTGIVGRVPAEFLGNPVLGRFIEKTPAQRQLDGDLDEAPGQDAKVDELRDFADAAGIDVSGLRKKEDLRGAIDDALEGRGLPTAPDPNAPVAAEVDEAGIPTNTETAADAGQES